LRAAQRIQLFDWPWRQPTLLDKTYEYSGLNVFVDQASLLYMDGAESDSSRDLEGSGFNQQPPGEGHLPAADGSSFQV